MSQGFVLAGKGRAQAAMRSLSSNPERAIILVAGAILTGVCWPIWGILHTWAGWHKCRERMEADGVAALGEVLAPDQALHDYRDGIWRGLFRVHAGSIAFVLLQAPIMVIAGVPYAIAQALFAPVGMAYTSQPELAMVISVGIPAVVGIGMGTVVFGQQLLAFRVLGSIKPAHRTGTAFHATGASWRGAAANIRPLVSMGLLTSLVAGAGGAVAFINVKIASELEIRSAATIGLWIAIALGILVVALLLEALSTWADECDTTLDLPAEPYSFTAWLIAWIVFLWNGAYAIVARILNWIIGKARLLAVGTVVFVLVMVGLEGTSGAFDDGAWSGLAWFLGAAGLLLYLRHQDASGGEA